MERGPAYGYFANPDKTWHVAKEDKYNKAKEFFHNTNLNLTKEDKCYLGSGLGNDSFLEAFVQNKVAGWVKEIETLSEFAKPQPHAAFVVYTHCILCTNGASYQELHLESQNHFNLWKMLPCFAYSHHSLDEMPSAPWRGNSWLCQLVSEDYMGIPNPVLQASSAYHNSRTVSDPLTLLIIEQTPELSEQTVKAQSSSKSELRKKRLDGEKRKHQALMETMPAKLKRAVEVASEMGASTWLIALPLEEHVFS